MSNHLTPFHFTLHPARVPRIRREAPMPTQEQTEALVDRLEDVLQHLAYENRVPLGSCWGVPSLVTREGLFHDPDPIRFAA